MIGLVSMTREIQPSMRRIILELVTEQDIIVFVGRMVANFDALERFTRKYCM